MPTTPLRAAARVIILDDEQRVLLLYYAHGGFWATPGGAREVGEAPSRAARRELHEELGISANVELSGPIAERSREHRVGGRLVRQVEQYFLARLAPTDINPARATQTDNIHSSRWWPLDELHATSETIYPVGLSGLLARLLTSGLPDRPVVLE